jgi:hypothetical protein
MAPSSDNKGKKPMEEDHQDLKLKEEQVARGSRARNPTFVGSMNAGHAFSHNMQGPTFPVLDLNFMPVIKEGMLVTDELCAQYRVLERGYKYFKKRISGFTGCWNFYLVQG